MKFESIFRQDSSNRCGVVGFSCIYGLVVNRRNLIKQILVQSRICDQSLYVVDGEAIDPYTCHLAHDF